MWILSILLWLITMASAGFGIVQMVRILLLVTKHSTKLGQKERIYVLSWSAKFKCEPYVKC